MRRRGRACREAVRLVCGDASAEPVAAASVDIVLASTVFSSLLDDAFQQRLAAAMWRWLKPGGGVLWYDFTVDNPRNRDVRGVPLARIRALFPEARLEQPRASPWRRRSPARSAASIRDVSAVQRPSLLRTHVLCWLGKAREAFR